MNNRIIVKKNLIATIGSMVITMILGIIIPRITLVGYGSEVNGLLSSVTQFLAYLNLFEAGLGSVASKALYGPVAKNDKRELNRILAAIRIEYNKVGIYYFIGLIILSAGFGLYSQTDTLPYITIFLVTFFSGAGNAVVFATTAKYRFLLNAEGKVYLLTVVTTITTIVTNVLKIVLLTMNLDVEWVIISSFVISIMQVVYIMLYVRSHYKWINYDVEPNYESIKERNASFVHSISWLIFSNTDIIILTIFCGLKVVSVYSLYKLVTTEIKRLIAVPWNSVKFAYGQCFNTNIENYKVRLDQYNVFHTALITCLFSVTWSLFPSFIAIYTSGVSDIQYVDKLLPVLFVFSEVLSEIRTPMLNTIELAGHFKQTMWRSILESVINLVVSLSFVYLFGIYGVLAGTIVAMLYRTVDIAIYANVKVLRRSPVRTLIIYSTNIILMCFLQIIYNLFNVRINNLISFFIAGIILMPVTVVVYIIMNYLINKNLLKEIRMRLIHIFVRKAK